MENFIVDPILKKFIDDKNIKQESLDFFNLKIVSKNPGYDIVFVTTEPDSLLICFEKDKIIEKVYQMGKEGRTFKINIPNSVLNFMNTLRSETH